MYILYNQTDILPICHCHVVSLKPESIRALAWKNIVKSVIE